MREREGGEREGERERERENCINKIAIRYSWETWKGLA